ncbi:MAG: hypothetical protein AB7F43_03010 [Bacteriovoracia bacterium]
MIESAEPISTETSVNYREYPGIVPDLLLEQVQNTVPFLFDDGFKINNFEPHLEYLRLLKRTDEKFLSYLEYFKLCLSAHHATVASFVPTDVDIHIRFKLWKNSLADDHTKIEMARLVLESRTWDYASVSRRWVRSPAGESLSGHTGEWFSTAVPAYCSIVDIDPKLALEIEDQIISEIKREAKIFADLHQAKDGIGALKAATVIAHNLGDLDRVIDLWKLTENSNLYKSVYKAGHESIESLGEISSWLIFAGDLNKRYMATENHRHLPLRKVRCLRKSADFLLPFGPFLDDWGSLLACHSGLAEEELSSAIEGLIDGFVIHQRQGAMGYARALRAIEQTIPGGLTRMCRALPSRVAKTLKTGVLRTNTLIPQARFELAWSQLPFKRH